MNHLAHLALADALADPSDGLIIGGFLGDYVKGRLGGQHPPHIEQGIALHRAIDAFTDQHTLVRNAQGHFPGELRRYAGIITDILFDHLLAQQWESFYSRPLPAFTSDVLSRLVAARGQMPDRAADAAQRMHSYQSLAGYGEPEFVVRSLDYLGQRLKRANPLKQSASLSLSLLPLIEQDFIEFYPRLIEFCEEWANKR